MNLKEQVLNKEQVEELIDLGFDVKKYASLEIEVNCIDCNEWWVRIPNGFATPTLSVGDIIDLLPRKLYKEINKPTLWLDTANYYNDYNLLYAKADSGNSPFSIKKQKFIDVLFETLKWCIINKHIE